MIYGAKADAVIAGHTGALKACVMDPMDPRDSSLEPSATDAASSPTRFIDYIRMMIGTYKSVILNEVALWVRNQRVRQLIPKEYNSPQL